MSDGYLVEVNGYCFRVKVGGVDFVSLSLHPQGFYESSCICGYPLAPTKRHLYHGRGREIVRRPKYKEYRIMYETTVALGMYYERFYSKTKIQPIILEELRRKCCRDLDSLLSCVDDWFKHVKPRANLLSVIVNCIKVSKDQSFYNILGDALCQAIKLQGLSLKNDEVVITYVPKHPDELKEDMWKGEKFNQAQLIAEALGEKLGRPVVEVLEQRERRKAGRRSRWERYEEAYRIYDLISGRADMIKGKTVLLVDDVRTSGATITALAEKLAREGASRIYVVVVARTVMDEDYDKLFNLELSRCKPPWMI